MSGVTRTGLLVLFSVLLVAALGGSVFFLQQPQARQVKSTLYQYTQQGDLSYRVYYNNNPFFPGQVLGPGQTYLSAFIDHINTYFTYVFQGQGNADLSGTYGVTASLVASQSQGQGQSVLVWQNDYVLAPETPFRTQGNYLVLNKTLAINYQTHVNFVKALEKAAMVSPDTINLAITWNVNINVQTSHGSVQDKLSPTLTIPIGPGSFTIASQPTQSKQGKITGMTQISNPGLKPERLAAEGAAGLLFLGVLCLLIFTRGESTTEQVVRKRQAVVTLDSLLKKYADRLVAGQGEEPEANTVAVASMDDLIRAADEVDKPVLYFTKTEGADFYVYDSALRYCFTFKQGAGAGIPSTPKTTMKVPGMFDHHSA
jgi:hypothetical protein